MSVEMKRFWRDWMEHATTPMDTTLEDELALLLAQIRTGGSVYMSGKHNPTPSERRKAREFLEGVGFMLDEAFPVRLGTDEDVE